MTHSYDGIPVELFNRIMIAPSVGVRELTLRLDMAPFGARVQIDWDEAAQTQGSDTNHKTNKLVSYSNSE